MALEERAYEPPTGEAASAAPVGGAVGDRGYQDLKAPQIIVRPAMTIMASRMPE